MRKTGTGFLRDPEEPNVRLEDGDKDYWLCRECEQRFSARETQFARWIFYPFLDGEASAFDYDERLFYFLVSLLWRTLHVGLDEVQADGHPHLESIVAAEEEWRQYLLGEGPISRFGHVHLLLTDTSADGPQPVRYLNTYMTRDADGTIVSSSRVSFVYTKFARFVLFGMLTPYNESEWVGTRIHPDGGHLSLPQEIHNGHIGEFMLDRARTLHEMYDTQISDNQRQRVNEYWDRNSDRINASGLGQAVTRDRKATVDPRLVWPDLRKDESCPCGSGRAFGACHGDEIG